MYRLVRPSATVALAALAGLAACGSVQAASDVTVAAITAGRLYVVGTTDTPHTPVVLDGQFQTESDDKGRFQYELLYHPARCVVSATIEGKAYGAVVSNCAEQCAVPMTGATPSPSPGTAASKQARAAAPPVQLPDGTSLPRPPEHLPAAGFPQAKILENPPLPPARAVQLKRQPAAPPRSSAGAEPRLEPSPPVRTSQPTRGRRKPQPSVDEAPDDGDLPVAN
jgi:hypothetical protein